MGNRVFDDDRLGSDLDLFDHQPEHALAIDDIERSGSIVELRQEAFEALGERVRRGMFWRPSSTLNTVAYLPSTRFRAEQEESFNGSTDEPCRNPEVQDC
jgi:hypothetical protein